MRISSTYCSSLLLVLLAQHAAGYNISPPTSPSTSTSRRDCVGRILSTAAVCWSGSSAAQAFDGTGSSAYSGMNPSTKAELKKSWRERIAADVKDFKALGQAIDRGETEGKEWINFFIQFQRREADGVGRTFAALADLRGVPVPKKKDEYEGGDGLLLANTFTKAGKPPDNTPAVKSFRKLAPAFDTIEAAGKKGDASKAKAEWGKTKVLFFQYLADVEMPSDLNDPIYN